MLSKSIALLSLGLAVGLAGLPAASASPVNYGDYISPRSSEVDFLGVTESSSTDPTPLFGDPLQVNNQLIFPDISFAAYAVDGTYDPTSGTLMMTIAAHDGYYLGAITASEIGDCTLLGVDGLGTWGDIYGQLTVTDSIPGTHGSLPDQLEVTPPGPYFLPAGFTMFNAAASIDLTGLGISAVNLVFTDILEASSELGTTAFIQKKSFGINVTTTPVPEPASALGLTCGLFTLLTRRRYSARL